MRDRIVNGVLAFAICLPQLALAQQSMPAAHRQGSWEIGVSVGGTLLDQQLQALIKAGNVPNAGRVAFGGVATLGYQLSRSWSLTAGSGVEFGSSATIVQPFGAISWTPNINAGTIPFVSLGAGVTNITWGPYRATGRYGVHLGVGVRQMLTDRMALRAEVREQYESFQKLAAPNSVFNGIGSVGLSWFLGGRIPVAAVAVTPAITTLDAIGATRQLGAVPSDRRGRPLAGRPVTWSSSDPAVVAVSRGGVVTAQGAGTATITAASERATGSATITVAPVVATMAVSPASASLSSFRQTQTFSATAQDRNGHPIANPALAWTSSNPSVVAVSPSGEVTAVGNGTAVITAAADGQSAVATVTVAQAPASVAVSPATATLAVLGGTVQLAARAVDANGASVAGVPFAWTSDAPAVAAVSAAGLVTAIGNGTAHVVASARGVRGEAVLTVAAPARVAPPAPVAAAPLPAVVGRSIVLRSVTFRPNSAVLSPAASAALDTIATAMLGMPEARWEVAGYTNSIGKRADNLRLSEERAANVQAYLVSRGVPASSLVARGYGSAHPIASNRTALGRRLNIRVEVRRLR